ncbi:MAG TPA: flagellar hook-length control protein FliK [Pseudobacteroides sp.]|nr:flagellar hook-length control protein FliK [Pseudobacteroides sp.]
MKITHFNDSITIGISNIDDIVSKLDVGDSLRARVVGMTGNELVLKLTDGSLLKAASMVPLDLKQGQLVDFIVKNKIDGKIFIETVRDDVQRTDTNNIKNALISMDIKPDEKSLEIANAIKLNNMPLNKDTFTNIVQSLKFFKNISPLKAAFLAANNLNIDEKNISALNSLLDNSTKIGKSINSLKEMFESMDDIELLDKIEANLKKAGFSTEDKYENSALSQKGIDKAGITKVNSDNNETLMKLSGEIAKAQSDSSVKAILSKLTDEDIDGLSQLIKGSKEQDFEALLSKLREIINKNASNTHESDKIIGDKAGTLLKNVAVINVKNKAVEDLFEDIKTLFQKIKNTEKNTSTNEGNDKGIVSSQSNINENKSGNNISKVLDSLFVRIDSDTLKDDLHAKSIYKDINSMLEIIKDTVSLSDNAMKDQIINKTDSMQNMIRFLNDINNHSTFLQIPLKIVDGNTNCDIYVLKKNPGKKKIDPDNATAYISLDTNNIGKVDTLIKMSKKNISINMIVENDGICNFVKSHYSILYKSLREKGYNLADLKCRVSSEDVNFINASSIINEDVIKRGSIDYKV